MSFFVIPAIDLRDGHCVRLTQGRKDNVTVYDGDPIEIALSYEASGASMIHLVDLDCAFSDPNSQSHQALADFENWDQRTRHPNQPGESSMRHSPHSLEQFRSDHRRRP